MSFRKILLKIMQHKVRERKTEKRPELPHRLQAPARGVKNGAEELDGLQMSVSSDHLGERPQRAHLNGYPAQEQLHRPEERLHGRVRDECKIVRMFRNRPREACGDLQSLQLLRDFPPQHQLGKLTPPRRRFLGECIEHSLKEG